MPTKKIHLAILFALIGATTSPFAFTVQQSVTMHPAYAEEDTHAMLAPEDSISQSQTQSYTTPATVTVAPATIDKVKIHLKKITPTGTSYRKQLIDAAMKYRGVVPYVFGGATPSGWDCSGFTSYMYGTELNISLAHSVATQSIQGKEVSASDAQAGDLVIFSKSSESNFHVGIYLGNGMMLHAPQPGENTKVGSIHFEAGDSIKFVNVIDSAYGISYKNPYYKVYNY